MRVNDTLSQANNALAIMEEENWGDCSTAHIERMRQLTVDIIQIDEIGYYGDGRLLCTIWGNASQETRERAPDQILPDGLRITLNVDPAVSRGSSMMAVSHQGHVILFKAQRMVDVLLDRRVTLGVALEGGNWLPFPAPPIPPC